ncbi:MAG TPA: hypothetical protein PKW45_20535 [Bryobacteraceae bacterium]|nr:hypothetical protein [Bryobacteraceae bacterium]
MVRATTVAMVVLVCTECLVLAAQNEPKATQTPARRGVSPPSMSELDKAVEEFKQVTRELGLRPDSPRRKGRNGGRRPVWHGRIFENFRNDFLDALPHEARQRGAEKSTLRRNQFGLNIAGPVLIPRIYNGTRSTYFSLSYEGVREKISRSYLRTIPTLPERIGDWSATVDAAGNPLPIYDPLTTRPNPDFDPAQPVSTENLEYLRDPFPENRIPSARIDPVAQEALEFYPAPNTNVGPFFRNNYFIHSPETNIANGMIANVDHTLRERHRLSLGLSFSNGFLGAAKFFPNAANPGSSDRNFHSRRGSLEYVFTASARTVNTFTFEASTSGTRNSSEDDTDYPTLLGLTGSPGKEFPILSLGPYLSMGRYNPTSKDVRNSFVWTNAFSTRRGRHGFRAVAQYTAGQVHTYWPGSPSGSFSFAAGLTSLPGIVNTGHAFASFLLGLSHFADLSVVRSPSYFRTGSALLSLRHSYEASKGLNFSVGLNIQNSRPRTEKWNRQSTVDLSVINPANDRPGALIVAGRDGVGDAFKPAITNFAPSASFSWNPRGDTKTVLRGSFSRSYSGIPVYFGQWGTQGFNGTPTFISPNVQLEPAIVLSDGLPPVSQAGPNLSPDAANDTIADLADRSDLVPVYQSASLSLEREAPGNVVVTIGASYAGGRNLYVSNGAANPNALPLEALQYRDLLNDEQFNRSLRPFPQYKGFDLFSSWPRGRYKRDAGFLRIEKRASAGLSLSMYYEFAKQMDDYSGPGTQDYFNSKNEWSLTAGHRPHRFSLSYMYELPFGSGKPLLAFNDWRRHLVNGWSISGLTTFYSGDPLALRPMFNNTGGVISSLRVNAVPGVDPHVAKPSPELWFNPAAFDQPPDFTMGTVSRTHPSLTNPSSQNHDLSLVKRFALAADRAVEFSAVGLNFINHANWSNPDPVIGPASAPNVNAGKIIGSYGGRIIQLGLRYTF